MAQTMYAHMNKKKNSNNELHILKAPRRRLDALKCKWRQTSSLQYTVKNIALRQTEMCVSYGTLKEMLMNNPKRENMR
jgi:hypothetical protein